MKEIIKPDVLITWPSGCDYPLCRLQLTDSRPRFKDVVITFYPHGTPDFRPFIRQNLKDSTFCESLEVGPAWRETAVNIGLDHSMSEWVLFTEQDFFWKSPEFLKKVFEAAQNFDIVGIRQGTRLHPCFLLTRRVLIEKTSKDFSVHGLHQDHFQFFSEELLKLGKFVDIKDLGLFNGVDWYHMSSLTWNLFRIKDGDVREMHQLEDFMVYNAMSRTKKTPQDRRWEMFTFYADQLLSSYGRFLNI